MPEITRRRFLAGSAAASLALRALPVALRGLRRRRVLRLVYDKARGGLRAIDRVVD